MIGLKHSQNDQTLWLTGDHLVLSRRRVQSLSDKGGWQEIPLVNFGRARQMRRELTPPEGILWSHLRGRQLGLKFRRQHPLGPYIADFYARQAGLVVEVDGESHFQDQTALAYDARRDQFMASRGLKILRFSVAEIVQNLEGVLEVIHQAAKETVLDDEPDKQWRYAGELAVGDTVFFGLAQTPSRICSLETQDSLEEVYDLEVEEAHSFLTEVCAVHNCGSGTTAYVAEKWGRRWITLDTSRVALALARTRLMAAKYPYYLLADTPEGVKKEGELSGKLPPDYRTEGDLKKGFVYKRVPHVTLKAIANNEEIDAIHTRCQEKLEPLRQELNRLLSQAWEEWQLPREAGETCPPPAKDLLAQWWNLRRERQQEIDAAIARRADTELLYDQPYEDSKRLRVTGPFTVESLSPHRVLAPEVELPDSEAQAHREADLGQFETMILDNLKKAGVQNTVKNERLIFERLEPYAGEWLHATGEYAEAEGAGRRVAVCIGPEHGTVGPDLIKEAAKEAVRGVGFDLLIVCGFAFDPHVAEEAKRYGKLTVLTARMNPDLAMGDELLKKTGAGNLFMVFGEPDVEVRPQPDGKIVVQIKGLDIYDPTTGQIRSSSTDDLAAWFIDTNYNGESFFVRHAYFTGADQPYDKLKRALRADIDEAAWSALYSTTSRPFPKPATGKIAIKVINHYGDEELKVFEV